MKFTNLALAVALSCGLAATGLQAQEGLREAALTYNYYSQEDATPSPSDLTNDANDVASDLKFVGADKKSSSACQNGCDSKGGSKGGSKGSCGCGSRGLFPVIGNGWEVSGFLAAGVTFNADHPVSKYNGPMTFNDRDREFQFNQAYMSFGRDVDNGGCGWDWGARMDLLYGTDYIFTQAAGLELDDMGNSQWNGHRHYGLAMPQVYADVAYNDLTVRLGHFYTIMGYEVVPANGNFFYSHAYTMQYGEPFTHTGGLLMYDYSDRLDVIVGLVNGWDKFDAETDRMAFLGGLVYTPCHERYTLTATLITGEEDGINGTPGLVTRTGYSLVFDYAINDCWNYVLQHDNYWEDQPGLDNEWYGINQYLFYTLNDCWKFGARFEWFRDDDGARLSSTHLRETAFGRPGVPQMAGAQAAGDYYGFTLGANWTPRERIAVRPEVRWDWSDGTGGGAGMGLPFDGGTKDSQFTAAFDVILTY